MHLRVARSTGDDDGPRRLVNLSDEPPTPPRGPGLPPKAGLGAGSAAGSAADLDVEAHPLGERALASGHEPPGSPEDPARVTASLPRPWRTERGLLAALAVTGLWLVWITAPRAIQAGDAGEFTTVMLGGGIPHPSGYPWMRILGLPAQALARVGLPGPLAAALPCAVLGWVGWCLLAWSVLRHVGRGSNEGTRAVGPQPKGLGREGLATLGAGRDAHGTMVAAIGVLVVALVATSGLAILHVHDAEVWGPLVLGVALVIHVGTYTTRPQPALLGLVLGLATSHHLTAVLLTPFVVGAAWPRQTSLAALARTLAVGLGGVAIGLSPLLTLFVGARSGAWRWGDTTTLEGWLHHVLRRDFGTFQLGLQEVAPPYTVKLEREFASLGESLLLPTAEGAHVADGIRGVVAMLLGIAALSLAAWVLVRPARPRRTTVRLLARAVEPNGVHANTDADTEADTDADDGLIPLRRSTRWGVLGTLALACFVFPSMANLDPRSLFAAWIIERFDLLPLTVLAWVLAIAGARAAARLPSTMATGLAAALAGLVVVRALANAAVVAPAHEAGVEAYARDVLASPGDASAVIFGTDDHRTFPALYVASLDPPTQAASYVDASLLTHGWYRARFAPAIDLQDKPVRSMDHERQRVRAARVRGEKLTLRAMYVTHAFSRPVAGLPLEPEGILWRVVIDPDIDRRLDAVVARHEAALARCAHGKDSHAGLQAPRSHPWSSDLHGARAAPTRALLERLQAEGRYDLAERVIAAWIHSHGE